MPVTIEQKKYQILVSSGINTVTVSPKRFDVIIQRDGIQGRPGLSAEISADAGNILTFGSDSKLYASETQHILFNALPALP